MKTFLLTFLILLISFSFFGTKTQADTASQSAVSIQVTINGYYLNLSGYIAPYASITLTSNGTVFASTTADSNGNFFFPSVRVAKGFNSFCLDAVDYKRLGESEACFSTPPVLGNFSKSQIFLPPTLGVFRTNVTVGNDALVWGYGMPNASISIKLDGIVICERTADKNGYYECKFAIQKEGNHQVYAESKLNNIYSEPQLKRVLIKGIALIKAPTPVINKNFTALPFGLPGLLVALFVIFLLLIGLIIWLKKFHPTWVSRLPVPNPSEAFHHAYDALFRERKLHHWWMQGVGY